MISTEAPTRIDTKSAWVLAFTLLIWGSAVVGIRGIVGYYSPGHIAMARFVIASVILGATAAARRMRLPAGRDLPAILLVSLFGVFVYHSTLNYGLTRVTAGAASMIVNTTPVFTAALAAMFLGERMRLIGWTGTLVSLVGAGLIGVGETMAHDGRIHISPEASILLISAIAWAISMVVQKPLLDRYTAIELTTYTLVIGTIPLLIYAPGFIANVAAAPLAATLVLVYLGTIPIAVAYSTWAWVLARMDASRAASFLYLIPVIATAIGAAALGEIPASLAWVGGALVLAGVITVNRFGKSGNTA